MIGMALSTLLRPHSHARSIVAADGARLAGDSVGSNRTMWSAYGALRTICNWIAWVIGDEPQVSRVPLREEAIEREVAGVAGAELPVAHPLPCQLDRNIAGRATVDDRGDGVLLEHAVQDRDHARIVGLVVQHAGNRRRKRRSVNDIEVACQDRRHR